MSLLRRQYPHPNNPKQPSLVTRTTPFGDLPEWLTMAEVRIYLHLSRRSLDTRLKSGAIPYRMFGGRHYRIPKTALRGLR